MKSQKPNQRQTFTWFALLLTILISLNGCAQARRTVKENDEAAFTQERIATPTPITMTVYKSPTCGCCGKWVDLMRNAGFEITVDNYADLSMVKAQHGVTEQLQSCHTALVGDYVIEGHMPVDAIERLLAEQPDVMGLAVPGMPIGSPGMEVEGRANAPFDVLRFDASGQAEVFASYAR